MSNMPRLHRRSLLGLGLRAALVPALAGAAWSARAEAFPGRLVKIIVPYPPGGTTDMLARALAKALSESYGQNVLVENRPGAGGNLGVDAVARAPRDGLTLGITGTNSFAINPHLSKKLPYDPLKDLTQVSVLGYVPNVLVVHPSLAVRSVAELVALARKTPLAFASPGPGTTLHLAGEMVNAAAGIDMTHVPYKGDTAALQDVVGGRVPVMASNLAVVLPHIRAGALRPLAVLSAKRASQLPELPTMAEAGYKDFDVSVWFTLFAPAGSPPAVLERHHREVAAALVSPALAAQLRAASVETVDLTMEQARAYTLAESERWGRVVRKLGITWD